MNSGGTTPAGPDLDWTLGWGATVSTRAKQVRSKPKLRVGIRRSPEKRRSNCTRPIHSNPRSRKHHLQEHSDIGARFNICSLAKAVVRDLT